MKSSILTFTASVLFSLAAANPGHGGHHPPTFQQRCARLAQTFHPDHKTQVLAAEFLPSGTNFTNPDNHPTCQSRPFIITLTDMCRLRLKVKTSHASAVTLEAWMPLDWNKKRYLVLGNGGLGGCIAYPDMGFTAWMGFATIAHDNGHLGNTGEPFLNNPNVVEDYAYRATKTATKAGKKAVRHFYNTSIKKSYFMGCSSGGRQGLKAAQDFPEEFDGIVAGAPANDMNNLWSVTGHYYKLNGNPGDARYLSEEQWIAMRDEILRQCDSLDGVVDGVIEEPRTCKPRFEALMCGAGKTWTSHQCLTAAQVDTVRKLYEPYYGTDGKLLYPEFDPGAEVNDDVHGGAPPSAATEWWKYAIFNNPNWNFHSQFSLQMAMDTKALDPFGVSTWKPLTKLKQKGRKLLTYHGLEDGVISSSNSYRYYEYVSRSMGLTSSELDSFYRYFPIPGGSHCHSGAGNWYVGATSQIGRVLNAKNIPTEGGVLMSMVKWVEEGVAPERITGRNMNSKTGVQSSIKEHCKWPKKNKYLGGDPNAKESWGCTDP
ncbi:Tannase and feruloyl esterase [Orbilia oligospora]|uniref:Carboxylic ester hydrolase n=1 Tax=Orbilia oligospora TaxID=2813651 RepID=A0A6G1M9B1_ORBOL|nr:Tannase and feruloyl esterase [Orbilia oligospora]KAF3230845.1 Tannase and feruloyl esterase [Orbilia oligospora]KAF3250246.1 Tannase and feruloyl esterase [Orbilia oligospora]